MNADKFNAKIKTNPRPVIIDLWAPWCAPCRAMEPAFQQISKKYENEVDVWKINADESAEVLKTLGVRGIPTIIGFSGGQEVIRKTGLQSAQSLDILFDATLHQRSGVVLPPAPAERWFRSIAGVVLILAGWLFSHSPVLIAIGAVVLFSGFYDRCPIFRFVAPRIAAFFRGQSGSKPPEKEG